MLCLLLPSLLRRHSFAVDGELQNSLFCLHFSWKLGDFIPSWGVQPSCGSRIPASHLAICLSTERSVLRLMTGVTTDQDRAWPSKWIFIARSSPSAFSSNLLQNWFWQQYCLFFPTILTIPISPWGMLIFWTVILNYSWNTGVPISKPLKALWGQEERRQWVGLRPSLTRVLMWE